MRAGGLAWPLRSEFGLPTDDRYCPSAAAAMLPFDTLPIAVSLSLTESMQRRYATVDVFTSEPFGGNPLAVVLDAEGLSTARMQAIATEFNYS